MLRLKQYIFMQLEVKYLGYRVSEEGVLPFSEKVGFLKNASSRHNISN